MEENKKYNAADFERYHTGAMLPDEMHALEKAALADPFLAAALDGYAYSIDAQKELLEIRESLKEKNKRKRVLSISALSTSMWWQVAAVFLVIAGIGYFLFQKSNRSYKASLAMNQALVKQESQMNDAEVMLDALDSQETTALRPNKMIEKIRVPGSKNNASKRTTIVNEKFKKEALKELSMKKEATVNSRNAARKANELTASKISATSDTTQSVSSYSADSSPGRTAVKDHVADTSQEVTLKKDAPSPNDAVVTGFGKKQKSANTQKDRGQLKGKLSGVQTAATPYLLEGKENFDRYIKEHATSFPDSVNIILSFRLDKMRKPTRIRVVSSSCRSCEKEAIQLLRNGPVWVGKPGAKATVDIHF